MKRIAFCLKVRKECLDEYRARHREVWSDMLEALHETGWHRYSLFLREDGTLFGYFETPDFDRAIEEMKKREVNARWQKEMAPFFEIPENAGPDDVMRPMEEIFHLD